MKRIVLMTVIFALIYSCKTEKQVNVGNLMKYKHHLDTNKLLNCEQKYSLLKGQIDIYFEKPIIKKQK